MAKGKIDKQTIRKTIKELKAQYSSSDLLIMSEEVFSVVEITGFFQDAKTIFIYNSMPDEVATTSFIQKWSKEKDFYLPVVVNDGLVFRKYNVDTQFVTSGYGIDEPQGDDFPIGKKIDLVIVPGVAFDRKMNRLGRGKGYYDRFLTTTKTVKMGVCFDFQLLDEVVVDDRDIAMDVLVSENDLIW